MKISALSLEFSHEMGESGVQLEQPWPSECTAGPVLALAVVEFLQMMVELN